MNNELNIKKDLNTAEKGTCTLGDIIIDLFKNDLFKNDEEIKEIIDKIDELVGKEN